MGDTELLMYPANFITGPGSRRSSTSRISEKITASTGGLVNMLFSTPATVIPPPPLLPARSMRTKPRDWRKVVLARK